MPESTDITPSTDRANPVVNDEPTNVSTQVWNEIINDKQSSERDQKLPVVASTSREAITMSTRGAMGASSRDDNATSSSDATRNNSREATRVNPPDYLDFSTQGGDIRPNSMVDNRTLLERFARQSVDLRRAQRHLREGMEFPPALHDQYRQTINDADNLPVSRIQRELGGEHMLASHFDFVTYHSETRLIEGSQRSPETQELVERLLRNVDRNLGPSKLDLTFVSDMLQLQRIAPDLARDMESRRELGRQSRDVQDRIDGANALLDKSVSTRFNYVTNLIDSFAQGNASRAVEMLTEILTNNPEALRYKAPGAPGTDGNRTMAEMILRSNALNNEAFYRAFRAAGGERSLLLQHWSEDRLSIQSRPKARPR